MSKNKSPLLKDIFKPPKGEPYRIFTQDVGKHGFSALVDISAEDLEDARKQAQRRVDVGAIVIPHSRKDLWPNDKGMVPSESILTFWVRPIIL